MVKITYNKKYQTLVKQLKAKGKLLVLKGSIKPAYEGWYYAEYDNGRFKGMYRWHDGEWWHDCELAKNVVTLMPIGKPNTWFGIDKT